MLKYPVREGSFWFPEYDDVKLKGRIMKEESNNFYLYLETSSFNDSVKIQNAEKDQEILINGILENSSPATFVVSLSSKQENLAISENKYKLTLKFEILFAFYGKHFNRIDGIKFDNIVITYQNLEKWITYHDSIDYFNGKDKRKTLKIDDKVIQIYYNPPISYRDHNIAAKPFHKVLYLDISSSNKVSLDEVFEIKSILQDFFNFFVTGYNVTMNSIYGLITEHKSTRIIAIEYKSLITEKMNKSKVITPFLKSYGEVDSKFQNLLNRLYDLRKTWSSIYHYYFGEIYLGLPVDMKLFLLSSFLESYHRIFYEKESTIRRKNQTSLQSISPRVLASDLHDEDKNTVMNSLKEYYSRIILKDRLREIFSKYRNLISINTPVFSILSEKQIEAIINSLDSEETTKSHILNIIHRKKELDLKIMDGRDRYNSVIDELLQKQNAKLADELRQFAILLSVEALPQQISGLRNAIAHATEKRSNIEARHWLFMVKILEFVCQLCMLSQMGFTNRELSEIFFLNQITVRQKIEGLIHSNIYQ